MSRLWSSSYKYFVFFFPMSNLSQTCRLIDWSGRNAWKHRLSSSKIKITLSSSQRYTHTIHTFIYFLFILGPHRTAQVRIERVRTKIPWPPKAKRCRVETSAKCLDPIRPWFFDIYCPENFTSSRILPPWRPAFGGHRWGNWFHAISCGNNNHCEIRRGAPQLVSKEASWLCFTNSSRRM